MPSMDIEPIPRTRRRKVEELARAAVEGIERDVTDFSSAELVCGTLTVALRVISTTLAMHPEYEDQLRCAVMPLLLACTSSSGKGN